MSKKNLKIWSITDGSAGIMSQADGLAAGINKNFTRKNCKIKSWARFLPFALQIPLFPNILCNSNDFQEPFPDVAIGSGKDAIATLRWIKKHSPKTFTIYILNPGASQVKFFDLVIATDYKPVIAKNAINTEFALHKITQEGLEKAKKEFHDLFVDKPKPWKSIIIGGTAPHYKFDQVAVKELLKIIHQIMKTKGSVFITTSRRTGLENIAIIEKSIKQFGNKVYFHKYDPENSANPYMAMLANSDALYITEDSVSMVSEACYTGKPVILLPLHNFNRKSIKKFTQHLANKNRIAYFRNETFTMRNNLKNQHEMDKIIGKVRKILGI